MNNEPAGLATKYIGYELSVFPKGI